MPSHTRTLDRERRYRMTTFNRFLERQADGEVSSSGERLRLECGVEVGGLVLLERID